MNKADCKYQTIAIPDTVAEDDDKWPGEKSQLYLHIQDQPFGNYAVATVVATHKIGDLYIGIMRRGCSTEMKNSDLAIPVSKAELDEYVRQLRANAA